MSKKKAEKKVVKKVEAKVEAPVLSADNLLADIAKAEAVPPSPAEVEAKAKKERKAGGPRKPRGVAGFMKAAIKEGKLTDLEIFEAARKAFPEWAGEGRDYYVAWYRWDLKRKGETVPENFTPIPGKRSLPAKPAAVPAAEPTDASLPTPTKTKKERKAKKAA